MRSTTSAARRPAIAIASFTFSVTSAIATATQCPGLDDAFENNDDCASAVALPLGLTQGLYTETRVGDHDYYTFQIPAGEIATVDVMFAHVQGNVDVVVHHAGCAGIIAAGFSQTDDEQIEVANGGATPLDIVIEVFVTSLVSSDCNTYDVLLTTASDPCAGMSDDAFEPNDDCASAAPMASGAYVGLAVFQDSPDHYRFTVQPGDELQVDCAHVHDAGDVNLFLFDPASSCGGGFAGSPLVHSATQTDGESLSWANTSATPIDVVLEVSLSLTVASGCNQYDLGVALVSDECTAPDDALEENDDCASAFPISPGEHVGLFVSEDDADFYSVLVQPGDVLGVHCDYTWTDGAIVMLLWDPGVACGTGAFSDEIALGLTPVDNERLFWLNDTGAAKSIVIEVAMAAPRLGRCNTYDLRVETFADPCPGAVGTIFCSGNVNSTGVGASLCAFGSDIVSENDVLLTVTDLPASSMGYFILSRDPNVTLVSPLGSSGQLCVASPSIGRQAPVLNSGGSGSVQLQIDLTATPQPMGTVAIVRGETWSWQYWHRDVDPSGSTTSNFSSARSIAFR